MGLMKIRREDGRTITSHTTRRLVIIGCFSVFTEEKGQFEEDITGYKTRIGPSWSAAGQATLQNVQISRQSCGRCEDSEGVQVECLLGWNDFAEIFYGDMDNHIITLEVLIFPYFLDSLDC
jgi:hypothetical protein